MPPFTSGALGALRADSGSMEPGQQLVGHRPGSMDSAPRSSQVLCRELSSRDAEHLVLGHRQDHSGAPMLGWMSNANRWPSSKTTVMEIRGGTAVTSTGAPPDPDGLPQFLLRDVVDVLMRLLAWPRRNGPTWPPESHRSMERKWRRMDGVGCGNGNEWHVCHSLIPQVRALSQASDLGPCSLTRKRSEVQIP